MGVNDYWAIHACSTHILGHAKTIEVLTVKRLRQELVNEKLWKRDLISEIDKLEAGLKQLKMIRDSMYTTLDD